MDVIFLDIDGVLNRSSAGTGRRSCRQEPRWDPDCVAALNRILATSAVELVVSSSWRRMGLDAVRRMMAAWGVRRHPIDCLLRTHPGEGDGPFERAARIRAWLETHPGARRHLALDDMDLHGLVAQHLTDARRGLTLSDAEAVAAWFHT